MYESIESLGLDSICNFGQSLFNRNIQRRVFYKCLGTIILRNINARILAYCLICYLSAHFDYFNACSCNQKTVALTKFQFVGLLNGLHQRKVESVFVIMAKGIDLGLITTKRVKGTRPDGAFTTGPHTGSRPCRIRSAPAGGPGRFRP